VLHVRNIGAGGGGLRNEINYKEVIKEVDLPITEEDLREGRLHIQLGQDVLCATLNFYDEVEDGYGSGRRAM
jgi:hypothetical protein